MSRTLTVFEHETLHLRKITNTNGISPELYEALKKFHGDGIPYYSLINNGVKFCEYVGVLQIGTTTIEILPKVDKGRDEIRWRRVLIDMLRSAGYFSVDAPTEGALNLKPNSILDLYIELFLKELTKLIREGLVKQYRKIKGNVSSLKGNLLFNKQIQENLLRPERLHTEHTTYDVFHLLHRILFAALKLISRINVSQVLNSKINALLLDFPEQENLIVTENIFQKFKYTRKTIRYENALQIARLLLLNYHPDIQKGNTHVLALLFDMNLLWERFVLQTLRRQLTKDKLSIHGQDSKNFWCPIHGKTQTLRPDIIINKGKENCVVLDTKWKDIKAANPSPDDLRQMYVYHDYYGARKVALIYPSHIATRTGWYYTSDNKQSQKECSVIGIQCVENLANWKKNIAQQILNWLKS